MTSKAAKKADNWTYIDPPIMGEIVHQKSKERLTLSFDARHRGRVEAIWPQAGKVVFDLATGYGAYEEADLSWYSAEELATQPHIKWRHLNIANLMPLGGPPRAEYFEIPTARPRKVRRVS